MLTWGISAFNDVNFVFKFSGECFQMLEATRNVIHGVYLLRLFISAHHPCSATICAHMLAHEAQGVAAVISSRACI